MSEISIQIDSNAQALLAQCKVLPRAMGQHIAAKMNAENNQTLRELTVKRMNFSSNGPVQPHGLRRQTGTAVRSLRVVPAVIDANTGHVESSVGSNLNYLRAQEEGFQGVVSVRAYKRRTFKYGKAKPHKSIDVVTKLVQITMRRSRRVVKDAVDKDFDRETYVRAHTMNMNLPARRFFAETFEERSPAYGAAISDGVRAGWDGVSGGAVKPVKGGAL